MSDIFGGSTWSTMLEYAQKSGCLLRNSQEIPKHSYDFSRVDFRSWCTRSRISGFWVGKTIQFRARVFMSDIFRGFTWSAMLEYAQKSGCLLRNSQENPGNRMIFLELISDRVQLRCKNCGFGLAKPFNSEHAYLWAIFLEALREAQCLNTHRKVVVCCETPRKFPSILTIFLELISDLGAPEVEFLVFGWEKPFNSEHAYLWAIFFEALREAQCLNTHRKVVVCCETPRKIPAIEWFFSSWFQIECNSDVKIVVLGWQNHSIPSTRIYERYFWRLYVKHNAWIRTEKWLFAAKLPGNSQAFLRFFSSWFQILVHQK